MKNKLGIFLMITGAVLIGSALSLLLYNQYEDKRAGQKSQEIQVELEKVEKVLKSKEEALPIVGGMPIVKIDGQEYIGCLRIPDLNLELPVMAEWDYAKLKIAPCRQNGSIQENNLVIAGHNYRRHFGKLSTLKPGSQILFTDVTGRTTNYTVGCIEVLQPNQGEKMLNSEWDLTLYTCTYGGKSRVTVRASRVYEQ